MALGVGVAVADSALPVFSFQFPATLPPSLSPLSSPPPAHASSRTFECTIYVSLVPPMLDILPASVYIMLLPLRLLIDLPTPLSPAHLCSPLYPFSLFYSCDCIFATWLAKSQRNNKSTSTLIIYLYIISMAVGCCCCYCATLKATLAVVFLNNARIFY